MLNVNQITSQLAKMPDNALQQYATMHKSDPYMLALTIAESNRRKEMRTAAQGAQGAMQQPKVADAAIAGMSPQQLPENVGIGALPADNMKGMAGGGIVAFEEGGQVPRFNGTEGSVPMSYEEQMSQLGQFLNPWDRFKRLIGAPGTQSREEAIKEANVDTAARMDPLMKGYKSRAGVDTPATADVAAPTPDTKKGLGALAGAGTAPTGGGGIAAGGAGTYKPSTLAEMMKEVSPEVEKMNAEDRKAMDPFRKQFEEERGDLAKRKESNKAEALLAAGLGMMSGSSRHALQNIGAGAQQGLTALKEANRADDAAKRALMQSEMHLAQAEMQGRKGNFQSMNQLANQARQEKQFATSSALQAQQIAQQGQYYRDMGEAAKARGGMDAKVMGEYTKVQKTAAASVDKDIMAGLLKPEQKDAMIVQRTRALAMDNPLLARFLSMSAEDKEPVTRTLD